MANPRVRVLDLSPLIAAERTYALAHLVHHGAVLAAVVGVVGLHIQPTGFCRSRWGHGGSRPERGNG